MILAINGRIGSGKDTVGSIIQFLVEYNTLVKKGYNSEQSVYNEYLDFMREFDICDNTWHIKKFADKLKDIVCLLTDCTREQLEDQEFKNRELGQEWRRWRLKVPDLNAVGESIKIAIPLLFNSEEEAWEYNDKELSYRQRVCVVYSELPTYRLLLQWIGTDLFRNQLHENVWVNSLMNEYKKSVFTEKKFIPLVGEVNNSSLQDYPNWIITDLRFPNELKAIKDRGGISIRVKRSKPEIKTGNSVTDFVLNKTKDFGEIEHPSETALDNATFDYEINNDSTIEELIEKVRVILIKEKII